MGGIVDVGLDLTGCLIWVNWFKKEGGVLFCTFSFGVVNGTIMYRPGEGPGFKLSYSFS